MVGLGRLFLRRRGGGYGDVYRDFYQPPIGQSASHNYCGQVEDECGRINYWIDWTLSVLPLDDALSSMFRLFVPPRSGSRMRQVSVDDPSTVRGHTKIPSRLQNVATGKPTVPN